MKYTIEHYGIMSEDPFSLADWYCQVLGFKKLFSPDGENMPVFINDEDGNVLEFFQKPDEFNYPESHERRIQHLSLSISDFEEAVSDLESKGIHFADEGFTIFMDGRVRFFQDKEGNWIHLIYRPEMPWTIERNK